MERVDYIFLMNFGVHGWSLVYTYHELMNGYEHAIFVRTGFIHLLPELCCAGYLSFVDFMEPRNCLCSYGSTFFMKNEYEK